MRNGFIDHRHANQMLFSSTIGFAYGQGHIGPFFHGKTNTPLSVANNHRGSKPHSLSAFCHTGYPGNIKHPLFELLRFVAMRAVAAPSATLSLSLCHMFVVIGNQ